MATCSIILGLIVVFIVNSIKPVDFLGRIIAGLNTSSGIFWMIVIFAVISYLDIFEEIIKDIVRSKVWEFVTTRYFKEQRDKLTQDKAFRDSVREIIRNIDEDRPKEVKRKTFNELTSNASKYE